MHWTCPRFAEVDGLLHYCVKFAGRSSVSFSFVPLLQDRAFSTTLKVIKFVPHFFARIYCSRIVERPWDRNNPQFLHPHNMLRSLTMRARGNLIRSSQRSEMFGRLFQMSRPNLCLIDPWKTSASEEHHNTSTITASISPGTSLDDVIATFQQPQRRPEAQRP